MTSHPEIDTSPLHRLVLNANRNRDETSNRRSIALSDGEEPSGQNHQDETEGDNSINPRSRSASVALSTGTTQSEEREQPSGQHRKDASEGESSINTRIRRSVATRSEARAQAQNGQGVTEGDNSFNTRSRSASISTVQLEEREQRVIRCTDEDAAEAAACQMLRDEPWKRVRKWTKPEEKQETSHPDDEAIDILVRDNEDRPTSYWYDMVAEYDKKDKAYALDYIVATEPGLKPEDAFKKNRLVLIKWASFAVPTWDRVALINSQRGKSDQVRVMEDRLKLLQRLELKLRSSGPDFDAKFPHRWLPCKEGEGDYVENKRALYENRLRAGEWRMNFEHEKAHEDKLKRLGAACKDPVPAPLYLVNWVDDAPVPGVDKNFAFKFVTTLQPSARVAEVLANTSEMEWLKCTECGVRCSYPREHFSFAKSCCGVSYKAVHHYADKYRLVGRVTEQEEARTLYGNEQEHTPGLLTAQEIESAVIVECTEACICKGNCRQRAIQRGRQMPLIIFREDSEKGWGVRAGADIAKGEFVTEYIGEVLTATEQADSHIGSRYMLDMRVGWSENLRTTDRVRGEAKPERRGHKPFSVDAANMGNESRFINHSCEPNLVAVVAYIERHGEFYHRIALFARRKIPFGEELTFDYFPSKADIEAWKKMFTKCRCGSKLCKFKDLEEDVEERKNDDVIAEEGEEEEDDDDDDDDWKSVDSFMSDDDEYQKQCKAVDEKKQRAAEKEERRKEKGEVVMEEDDNHRPHHLAHRDPYLLILERVAGDEAQARRIMDERRNGVPGRPRGILHLFDEWTPEKYKKMIDDAKASKARKAEARRVAEEAAARELEQKRRTLEENRQNSRKRFMN